MTFGKDYWDQHWQRTGGAPTAMERNPPNPYLVDATSTLTPGTALDAGCGAGAEAILLASQGWQVTAADISRDALDKAIRSATAASLSQQVSWLEADLTTWTPTTQYDLVTTHYAHPTIPQLAFYNRISNWVAPGGTLLLVGHLHTPNTPHSEPEHSHAGHGHGEHGHGSREHRPPAEASVGLADIVAGLDNGRWEIVAAGEHTRTLAGRASDLRDVVVQATRRL
ncbi:MAG: hypothetical protein QOH03_3191 [Kribbellaceae bacterium]|nr:hypothetical protein [Kribbellaceae bacterium]